MISPPEESLTTLTLGPESLPMRKINTRNFRLATRSTPREVNRRIVLNLIREYQPISRAELARRMQVHRGTMTPLVRELVESGVVFEKGTAATARGRRPTLLCVRTRGRHVVAVDIRPGRSAVALADVSGHVTARESFETPESPEALPDLLATEVASLLRQHAPDGIDGCQGLGIVLPGMVDRKTGRLIYAPRLGWRDVDLRSAVAQRVGMKCYIESAPIACALARLWLEPDATRAVNSFAYVSISDGIGVGLAYNGEMLRGEGHTAGEFGHVPLDANGPECVCGRVGCWESLACNSATVDRYIELSTGVAPPKNGAVRRPARGALRPGIDEVVRRARGGEPAAMTALVETGRHIGKGLALVVNAFNPGRVYVGGEITAVWELLEGPIRETLAASTITDRARATPVVPDSAPAEYRLRGAVALVTAPGYAALAVG
ncbi:MAG TPA: ROK family transcriptional regulator [Gemmatimonadaceae bacterium]